MCSTILLPVFFFFSSSCRGCCLRCNHTVTYCLSQHSQEFMSPAIDLWHRAQDRRPSMAHFDKYASQGCASFSRSRSGFLTISDTLVVWRNAKSTWKTSESGNSNLFWQKIWSIYRAEHGSKEMCQVFNNHRPAIRFVTTRSDIWRIPHLIHPAVRPACSMSCLMHP